MTQQSWWWVLGAVVVIGLIAVFINMKGTSPEPKDEGLLEAAAGTVSVKPSLEWEFAPAGGDPETGAYKTSVALFVDGERRELGVYTGSCSVLGGEESLRSLVEGEVTGVICWFAGGGDELGVFYENNAYVVKKGVIEEGPLVRDPDALTAEEPGLRGRFETLFTI